MIDRTPRLHVPMLEPTDVIPHLGKGQAHWRQGYSAHALATTWFAHNGFPPAVRTLLDSHPRFHKAELVDAILERKTNLRDGVRGHSQTDLLAIIGLGRDLAVVAVEGKVEESFGQLISEWLTDAPHKKTRIGALAKTLGADEKDISALRYQLLHRTVSAIYEAQRYRASTALLLVHSFSGKQSGWADFASFVRMIELSKNPKPNEIVGPKDLGRVQLYAAWLADDLPNFACKKNPGP